MSIVAYGYTISGQVGQSVFLVDDILLAIADEPDIILDSDIDIMLNSDDNVVEIEPDLDIEVE